ncbi:hypothetical protein [Paraburkholderia tagetis]|uniref:hypothetical protein n=1 Tax=Paraburkholderia tagetis TaxID=2913261 RepID=UPI001EE47316|nr:hypothetical protein [Paraburkholderia tagetis]
MIAANNADLPPFVTLISSRPPYAIESKIAFPKATGGLEQPVWDPTSGMVYVAVPVLGSTPSDGRVVVTDPIQHKLVGMDHVSQCIPAGLAVGPAAQLFVGCSDDAVSAGFPPYSLLLDTRSGKVTQSFARVGERTMSGTIAALETTRRPQWPIQMAPWLV